LLIMYRFFKQTLILRTCKGTNTNHICRIL